MANQTDFDALILRIDAATDRLEMDVMELEALINDAEGAVSAELIVLRDQAVQAANAASMSAQQASQSAIAASLSSNSADGSANDASAQVVLAQGEVANAALQVQLAKDEVALALAQADRAQGIADALNSSAPFQEAPINGNTYGRKDGEWSIVSGGSGGSGTVTSVNGVLPDGSGNVTLSIPTNTNQLTNGAGFITLAQVPSVSVPTKTSELTNDSGFITASSLPVVPTKTSELTNDSSFITLAQVPAQAISTDAPNDGKQYARQSNAWSEVVATGGGTDVLFDYQTAAQSGIAANQVRVCFNYALYNAIKTKGAYYWNDAATIDAVNSDAQWMTEAIVNPSTNPNVPLDIRYFRIYSLNPSTGAVLGHSGSTWNGTTWLPGNAFLVAVGQITGEYSDSYISPTFAQRFLPAGKWWFPAVTQNYTTGNQQGLPVAQIKVNGCVIEKTMIPDGGSAANPFGSLNSAFTLTWVQTTSTVAKGVYWWSRYTSTWTNVGVGTA